jgi:hypothetical protein
LHGNYANLKKVFVQADGIDWNCGIDSYSKYNRMMSLLAGKYGCSLEQATAVFVSTSPNNDYKNNLRSTVSILHGWKHNIPDDQIKTSSYHHCRDRSLKYLRGLDFLSHSTGPKIRAFYQNIIDPLDPEPITVDGHMVNAWTGSRRPLKEVARGKFVYEDCAKDIRTLAKRQGLIPCQAQGILWLTWKRINRILYDPNLDLFGDHWGYDLDVENIQPY